MIEYRTLGGARVNYDRVDDDLVLIEIARYPRREHRGATNGYFFTRQCWDALTAELFPQPIYTLDPDVYLP